VKREYILYLEDILEAITDVESFSKGLTKEKFVADRLRQSAILRQIEIMGEAVKNIPLEVRKRYPDVKWKGIAATRDILIHAYPGIQPDRIWNIVEDELSELKEQITKIIEKERKKR